MSTLRTGKRARDYTGCNQTAYLDIFNGKRINLSPKYPKMYQEFYNKIKYILNLIVKLRPDFYERVKKSKDRRGSKCNIDGTAVNYVFVAW